MQKIRMLALLGAVAAGIIYFGMYYRVQKAEDGWKLTRRPRPASNPWSASDSLSPRTGDTIRVASFNIQVFGRSKLEKAHVMEVLARIVRQFDVVAIQEIRSQDQDLIPRFVDRINEAGRYFDFVIGPRLGRTDSKEQYAFLFDRETLEVDRGQLYTVNDPAHLLHRPPLVAWFRVRGPAEDQAFTFSLVNLHVDPDDVDLEVRVLPDIYQAIRNDGRDEDDVILLGDFNASYEDLRQHAQLAGLTAAIANLPTNVRMSRQLDNLLLFQRATTEFTGRSGVFDFRREFDLTVDEALEISDHFPIWAEFTANEGGQPGRVAAIPQ